ncbi:hypothetical protein [Pseudomonas sp. CGJS7]|uniref:hypothetical protein n=1 Tax=Pseudomonas sp. CGJS7 TaxID=3109348 RepID=UPI00300A98D7
MSTPSDHKRRTPDLEQVIHDVAEHQREEDFELLYRLMANRDVYVPADPSTFPTDAVPGEPYTVEGGDRLQLRFVTGPEDLLMAACATSREAALLHDGFVGMEWRDFLLMVLKLDDSFYGALLQGRESWVAFDRERVRYILGLGAATRLS